MAAAVISTGCIARSVPLGARPTAVRAAETITASFMSLPSVAYQRFSISGCALFEPVGCLMQLDCVIHNLT